MQRGRLVAVAGQLQVGEPLPGRKVARAHEAEAARSRPRRRADAEDAVEPAVLVSREAHVAGLPVSLARRQLERPLAEAEARDAAVALRGREPRAAVLADEPRHEDDAARPLDRRRARHPRDPEPLDEERVAPRVEVVAPGKRRVRRGEHRVAPALADAGVVSDPSVLELEQLEVTGGPPAQRLLEVERHREPSLWPGPSGCQRALHTLELRDVVGQDGSAQFVRLGRRPRRKALPEPSATWVVRPRQKRIPQPCPAVAALARSLLSRALTPKRVSR